MDVYSVVLVNFETQIEEKIGRHSYEFLKILSRSHREAA